MSEDIIKLAKAHATRMQADIPTLIEKFITVQISNNVDVSKHSLFAVEEILSKWATYFNEIDELIKNAH